MEQWKTIEYRGKIWTISDHGNLKTVDGTKNRRLHKNSSGYLAVTSDKIYLIHRMVAIAFIPNPENKPFVNHINGDKSNNHISNLEWVTKKENEWHSVNVLGNKRNISGLMANWENSINKKPIALYCNDVKVAEFESQSDAAKYLNCADTTISNHLKGRSRKMFGRYTAALL